MIRIDGVTQQVFATVRVAKFRDTDYKIVRHDGPIEGIPGLLIRCSNP